MITHRQTALRLTLATLSFTLGISLIAQHRAQAEPLPVAEVKHDGPVDFQNEILPMLRRNCLACHNATDAESDLVLETPQTILTGGSEGPAAVAGKSADSLLLKLATHADDPVMPPEDNDVGAKNLTPEQLGLVKLWIDQGAKGEVSDLSGPIQWQPLPATVNPIYALAVSPHGKYVAAGRANQIFLYSAASKSLLTRLTDPALLEQGVYEKPGVAHLDLVQSLTFSPDGNWLASGGYRTVKLWQRPTNPQRAKLAGLEGEPQSLAVSPDGKLAAVGEASGKIKLFDVATGKVSRTLAGHTGPVSGVAFSSDGALLASGSQDKTFRVFNIADGKEVGNVETPSPINAVAFALDNKQIATGHADNKLTTWHLPGTQPAPAEGEPKEGEAAPTGPQPIKEFAGHGGPITSLIAVTGGTQLLSGSGDSTMRLWDAHGGNQLRTFSPGGPVAAVAISPDGTKVAAACTNNVAKVFRTDNGQQLAEMRGDHRTRLAQDDANRAVTLAKRHVDNAKKDLDATVARKKSEDENAKKAEENKTKTAAEMKTKQEAAKKPVEEKTAADAALAAIKPMFQQAEAEKTKLEAEAVKSAEAQTAMQKIRDDANKVADDANLATANEAKAVAEKQYNDAVAANQAAQTAKNEAVKKFNDLNTKFKQAENVAKQKEAPAQKATDELNAATRAFEAAERSVARGMESVKKAAEAVPVEQAAHKQREAEAATRQQEKEAADKIVPTSDKPWAAIAFTADGTAVATGGDDTFVHLWSAADGQPMDVYEGNAGPITALAASANAGLIAMSKNATGIVWDTAPAWNLVRTIGSPDTAEQFVDRLTALGFSPDSSLLATGGGEPSRSGELKIWKVADGALVRAIADAHSDTLFDLEFSPDGTQIASCAADRFAKVHNAADGKFVRAFEGHTHHVMGVSWRADGRVLATSGADKVVKVWDAQTGDQTKTITGWKKEVTAIKFVAVGDDMITAAGDPQVSLRDTNGGNKGGFGGPSDFIYTARVSDDGKTFAAGGESGIVRLWDEKKQPIANFEPPKVEPPAEEEKQAAK